MRQATFALPRTAPRPRRLRLEPLVAGAVLAGRVVADGLGERVAVHAARFAPAPAAPRERRPACSTALGLNAAARRLHRSKATISRLIAEGAVKTVPWPGRRQQRLIPLPEIERVEREGLASAPRPALKPRRVRKAPQSAREAAVARILAHEVE